MVHIYHSIMSGLRLKACPCCGASQIQKVFTNAEATPITDWREFFFGSRRFIRDLHECGGCGFTFINDIEPNYVRHYQAQESYEPARLSTFRKRYFASVKAHLNASVSLTEKPTLLDIGCAEGTWLSLWPGCRRVGAEYSAVHRAKISADGAEAVDPDELDGVGRFSVVSLFDVLEHLEDPRASLLKIKEHVAEGGCLILGVPDMGKVAARLLKSRYYLVCPMHFSYFTAKNLRALLENVFPGRSVQIASSPSMGTDLKGIVKWLPLGRVVPSWFNFSIPIGYSASLIAIVH